MISIFAIPEIIHDDSNKAAEIMAKKAAKGEKRDANVLVTEKKIPLPEREEQQKILDLEKQLKEERKAHEETKTQLIAANSKNGSSQISKLTDQLQKFSIVVNSTQKNFEKFQNKDQEVQDLKVELAELYVKSQKLSRENEELKTNLSNLNRTYAKLFLENRETQVLRNDKDDKKNWLEKELKLREDQNEELKKLLKVAEDVVNEENQKIIDLQMEGKAKDEKIMELQKSSQVPQNQELEKNLEIRKNYIQELERKLKELETQKSMTEKRIEKMEMDQKEKDQKEKDQKEKDQKEKDQKEKDQKEKDKIIHDLEVTRGELVKTLDIRNFYIEEIEKKLATLEKITIKKLEEKDKKMEMARTYHDKHVKDVIENANKWETTMKNNMNFTIQQHQRKTAYTEGKLKEKEQMINEMTKKMSEMEEELKQVEDDYKMVCKKMNEQSEELKNMDREIEDSDVYYSYFVDK